MTYLTKVLLLSIGLSLAPVSQVAAQQKSGRAVENKSQAADEARKAVNGRVLKVDKKNNGYRVKVLKKSGRVVSVDVDKKTGQPEPEQKKDDKG